jgi:FKBP-type peptidyl-prolyl cis-trans isomerase
LVLRRSVLTNSSVYFVAGQGITEISKLSIRCIDAASPPLLFSFSALMKYTLPSMRFWRPLSGGLLMLVAPLLLASCDDESESFEELQAQALKRQKEVRMADSLAINKYIADSSLTNVQLQPSGLRIVFKNTGTGDVPAVGQTASVVYRGAFTNVLNNRVFDQSPLKDGKREPFTFVIGQGRVIPGFDQGISLMRKGQKAILLMPSYLAYGPNGASTIPPDSPLRFDVELTDITR